METKGKKEPKVQQERSFEVGKDESWFAKINACFEELMKHLAELSGTAVESTKRNRTIVDKILSDAQQHDNVKQTVAEQALQNAVETANMVGKQAVRHGDIAIDRQWNIDEVANAATVIAAVLAKMGIEFGKPK